MLWRIKLNIHMEKTKFASNKQDLLGLLFSKNVKKTHNRPKYTTNILLSLKRNDSQTFKSSSCKHFFLQRVCYWYNLFQWVFHILCDNWKTLFFYKSLSLLWGAFPTTKFYMHSLKQVFWRSAYFILSPR